MTLALVSPLAVTLMMSGCADKPPNYLRRLFRRCQQINVADDFLDPPQTAGSATSDDVRMPRKTVE